ncbi:MAG TPA: hypothetical protein VF434_01585 [Promineifilum sp.]
MGKSQPKRRTTKTRTHQSMKGAAVHKKTNWIQIAAIVVGIVIVISMILAMIVIPGAPLAGS